MWKRRLSAQIKGKRRDLSRVEVLLHGKKLREHHKGEREQNTRLLSWALNMSLKISNKELLPRLQRIKDLRTGTNSSIKTDCVRHTRGNFIRR